MKYFRKLLVGFFAYLSILSCIFFLTNCKGPGYANPCDPNSKIYQNSLFVKSVLGDQSSYCSLNGSSVNSNSGTAPSSLVYSTTPNIFRQNTIATEVKPTISGGTPTSCTANPALPAGLSLNNQTCAISGTPTAGTAMTTYTVTASNSAGSATGSVIIQTVFTIPKYLYISNYTSGNIYYYSVNPASGLLTINGNMVSGTNTRGIAIDPTGKFLYAVEMGTDTISLHTINQSDGSLPAASSTLFAGTDPQSVAIHPTGKYVYVVGNGSAIYTFAADTTTGALVSTGNTPTGLDGVWAKVDPYGKFLYIVCQNPTNLVYAYSINQTTGGLTLINSFAVGTDPRSLEITPDGQFAYIAELNFNRVSYWLIDSTGSLSSISNSAIAGTAPQSVVVDPLGRFVFLGYDNGGTGTIADFSINSVTGVLTAGTTSTTATFVPTRMVMDPSGNFLYSANYGGDNVYVSTINQSTGAISVIIPYGTGTGPVGIAITGTN